MGLVEKVQGKLVGVDTSIFIYFIEKKNPAYIQTLREFFKKNKDGNNDKRLKSVEDIPIIILEDFV